jgi:hypothetical protein
MAGIIASPPANGIPGALARLGGQEPQGYNGAVWHWR